MDRFLLAAGVLSLVAAGLIFSGHEVAGLLLIFFGMCVAARTVSRGIAPQAKTEWDPEAILSTRRRADGIE